jgi:hypothetical protein
MERFPRAGKLGGACQCAGHAERVLRMLCMLGGFWACCACGACLGRQCGYRGQSGYRGFRRRGGRRACALSPWRGGAAFDALCPGETTRHTLNAGYRRAGDTQHTLAI